jgi:hypothetical protein
VPTRVLGTTDVVFCSAASKATEKQRYTLIYLIYNYNKHGSNWIFVMYFILVMGHKEKKESKAKVISFEKDTKIIMALLSVTGWERVFLRVFMCDRRGAGTLCT